MSDTTCAAQLGGRTSAANPTTKGSGRPPEAGRAAKSVRRRQRASRRAPTTMLNTNVANFRAMVQQFTGIPSAMPYSNLVVGGGGAESYKFDQTSLMMSLGHLQQQHHEQCNYMQGQDSSQQQRSPDGSNIIIGCNYVGYEGGGLLRGPSSNDYYLEVGDGFLFDGMHSQMVPTSTDSSHGFFS